MLALHILVWPCLAIVGSLLVTYVKRSVDSGKNLHEPPYIPPSIPLFGHLIGLLHHGTDYYRLIWYAISFENPFRKLSVHRSRYPFPVYTLPMPHGKTYVVNTLELVGLCQRNWKTLSFNPFVATFLKRLCLPSIKAEAIVDESLFMDHGLFFETRNAMHQSLAPGPDLNGLISSIASSVSTALDELLEEHYELNIDLYAWIRGLIALASTDAIYGKGNPFRDPEVMNGFW